MMVRSRRFLRLLYLARLTLAAGIFAGALLVWTRPLIGPETTLLATLVLVVSLVVTGVSFWHTHIAERVPSANFLYLQAIFDTLLVTSVVHLTGGSESDFASLYILVIAEGALMLPLRGGMLIGALATMLYFADGVWGHASQPGPGVFLQMALFAVTALVTAWLGERLRRTGTQLGAMELALRQLRLDTDDILGTIDTGVVTVDEDGKLAYINQAAETLLGVREREWLGRPVLKELDRRAPGLGGTMRRTSKARVPVHWYETRVHDASAARVLGVRTTALEREDRPWVTAVVQDISDGKRLEDLHRRADRLQAVAELAASLAHELKNPLASIRSATEQLTGGHVGNEDRKTLKTLVLAESDRLSRLLSEFIEFSRVEVNRRERVDLRTVVAGACRLASQHPDGVSGAPIRLRRADGSLAVDGDEDLLHRAVFKCGTPAPASRRKTSSASLILSTPVAPAARASAWHWCLVPWRPTWAPCWWTRCRARGPRSPSICPPSRSRTVHESEDPDHRRRGVPPPHAEDPAERRGFRCGGAGQRCGGAGGVVRDRSGRRSDRCPHARRVGHRRTGGGAGAGPGDAGDPDDGAGLAAVGDPGGEPGRVLLPAEAVQQRGAAGPVPAGGGIPQPEAGERGAAQGDPAPRRTPWRAAHREEPDVHGSAEAGG
ncbi:MAG: histidine kinase dimerization/phospho-acceptor domain-containing protein, partial [Gemmatimonadota bacterium]